MFLRAYVLVGFIFHFLQRVESIGNTAAVGSLVFYCLGLKSAMFR